MDIASEPIVHDRDCSLHHPWEWETEMLRLGNSGVSWWSHSGTNRWSIGKYLYRLVYSRQNRLPRVRYLQCDEKGWNGFREGNESNHRQRLHLLVLVGWFGCMDHLINLCVNDTIRNREDDNLDSPAHNHFRSFGKDLPISTWKYGLFLFRFSWAPADLRCDHKVEQHILHVTKVYRREGISFGLPEWENISKETQQSKSPDEYWLVHASTTDGNRWT